MHQQSNHIFTRDEMALCTVKAADESYRHVLSQYKQLFQEYFRKILVRNSGNEWTVPACGFDVENNKLHIFADFNNGHKSLESSYTRKKLIKMQGKLLHDKKAICILIETNYETPFDEIWEFPLNGSIIAHDRIRRMSMDKFFSLVFGTEEINKILADQELESFQRYGVN